MANEKRKQLRCLDNTKYLIDPKGGNNLSEEERKTFENDLKHSYSISEVGRLGTLVDENACNFSLQVNTISLLRIMIKKVGQGTEGEGDCRKLGINENELNDIIQQASVDIPMEKTFKEWSSRGIEAKKDYIAEVQMLDIEDWDNPAYQEHLEKEPKIGKTHLALERERKEELGIEAWVLDEYTFIENYLKKKGAEKPEKPIEPVQMTQDEVFSSKSIGSIFKHLLEVQRETSIGQLLYQSNRNCLKSAKDEVYKVKYDSNSLLNLEGKDELYIEKSESSIPMSRLDEIINGLYQRRRTHDTEINRYLGDIDIEIQKKYEKDLEKYFSDLEVYNEKYSKYDSIYTEAREAYKKAQEELDEKRNLVKREYDDMKHEVSISHRIWEDQLEAFKVQFAKYKSELQSKAKRLKIRFPYALYEFIDKKYNLKENKS